MNVACQADRARSGFRGRALCSTAHPARRPNHFVYDLGSGDGRILIRAAKEYGARGVGVELDPALVTIARQAAVENGVADKVSFVEGDLFAVDISPATVVTLFLWPSVNTRLEAKLRSELREGTRIVSIVQAPASPACCA
jgi:predicted RNA methylase